MARTLNLNWKVTTFSVVFLCTFVWLGFWQLGRAEEKVALLARESVKANRPPVSLKQLQQLTGSIDSVRVELVGRYLDAPIVLLDNRVLSGQVGFEVLSPFADDSSGMVVLVNRGFVAMGRTRDELPKIPGILAESSRAFGTVYAPEDAGSSTSEMVSGGSSTPIILQVPDPGLVADQFDAPLFKQVIRLDAEDPNALPRYWPVTVMSPEKHRGYALQWFLMALAVVIAWTVFTYRTQHMAPTGGETGTQDD